MFLKEMTLSVVPARTTDKVVTYCRNWKMQIKIQKNDFGGCVPVVGSVNSIIFHIFFLWTGFPEKLEAEFERVFRQGEVFRRRHENQLRVRRPVREMGAFSEEPYFPERPNRCVFPVLPRTHRQTNSTPFARNVSAAMLLTGMKTHPGSQRKTTVKFNMRNLLLSSMGECYGSYSFF